MAATALDSCNSTENSWCDSAAHSKLLCVIRFVSMCAHQLQQLPLIADGVLGDIHESRLLKGVIVVQRFHLSVCGVQREQQG